MGWNAYRDRLVEAIKSNQDQLTWMEEQGVRTQRKVGGEDWQDTTESDRQRYQDNIATFQEILARVEERIANGED